ncbi:MAG: STAS domain-containing protein [Cyclonatronaceae bacterium]
MNLNIDKQDGYVVITPGHSRLDSTAAPELKSNIIVMGNALETGDLIIDMQHVDFADSSGLSALLMAFRLYRDTERTFILSGLNERVEKLLQISRLTDSFTITKDLQEAVYLIKGSDEEEEDDSLFG